MIVFLCLNACFLTSSFVLISLSAYTSAVDAYFHPLAINMHSKWDSSHLTSALNLVLVLQSPRGRDKQLWKVINPTCCRNLL